MNQSNDPLPDLIDQLQPHNTSVFSNNSLFDQHRNQKPRGARVPPSVATVVAATGETGADLDPGYFLPPNAADNIANAIRSVLNS